MIVVGVVGVLVGLLEVLVIVQVAHALGLVPTLALLVVVGLLGARLCLGAGGTAARRLRADIRARRMPGVSLLDAVWLLVAGMLLVVPGFLTDAVGLLLLVPPVRRVARGATRALLIRRLASTAIRLR